jgi:hypothetical protein
MEISDQYSLNNIPKFTIVRVIEDGTPVKNYPGSSKWSVEIKPDPTHPWVKDWPSQQVFGIQFIISDYQMFSLKNDIRTTRELVNHRIQLSWEDWWKSHWRIDGSKKLTILERPEYTFVLGGAL